MAFSFGTPNTQSSTFTAATKPTFSLGVGATTTSTSGFGGFGTPATSTGFGSSGAPATSTAAPLGARGATPTSTAPVLISGTASGANAAKPTTGFGNTSIGTTPTFGSAAPTFSSAAPTFGSNILGGNNTFVNPFGGSVGPSFGTKRSTGFDGFGNTLESAPLFKQMKFRIRCQAEQTKLQAQALQQAAGELAGLHTRRTAASALLVQLAARLNTCRPTLLQVVTALSPEEEAAWVHVNDLTSQGAAPPAPLDNDPDLENHPSVEVFRNVRGVEKNIYFFTHDYREQDQNDINSCANHKEADMTLALANYLMQQGYTADDITILAAYSGQMFYMRKERQKYASLSHVKITVVDNYQGEESKIILLSLVRNNEENISGSLGADNRVCVALSRAKEGLYIFGNINMMKTAKSGFWTKIATTLENNGSLGTTLNLKCPAHPDQITTISAPEDLDKLPPDGGCFQKCNYQYDCGHQCQLPCHLSDREHINNKCTMKCERVLCELGHVCPLECCVDCEPCEVDVRKTLPCGHEINKLCHLYLEDPQNKCLTTVNVTLPDCEHQAQKLCCQDINEVECSTLCGYRFECGHVCRRKCHVTDDPNHEKKKCEHPCGHRLECGHVCQRKCHVTDDPNHEKVVARQEVAQAALSPEEEAAWARVRALTSQRAAPLDYDPDLGNHPSVEVFRNVPGVEKNIYFFNHDYREQILHDNNSCANHKEADMTLALANYLMQQGYTADDITILTTYLGQMFYMTKKLRMNYRSLSHVKITVVDNYQGEESKIILLSLVRNKEENIIGSLGADNKVCVALSRAKEGLYIFGNIDMLKTAKSGFWTKIATNLKNNGCLGTTLILKCQNHPDQITTISTAEDFLRIKPHGGCFQKCNYQYACGHQCLLSCHGYDREHIHIKCRVQCQRFQCELGHENPFSTCWADHKPCRKTFPCGHLMNTFSHRDVEDPQNKCLTKVDVTFPNCKHEVQKYCYQDLDEMKCFTRCEYRLECGHLCERWCHVTDDPNHEKYICWETCKYPLECGHVCGRWCHDVTDDPNHEKHKCVKPCEYWLECGHVCEFDCHVTDDPNHDKHKCVKPGEYRLEGGHVCDFDCHVTDDPNHDKVVARQEVAQAALSPEEEAAWARVRALTSQGAAPLDYDPDLGNHPNVEVSRNVPGVEKNIYFFNHDYREQPQDDHDSTLNYKEADMTLALANYLMQQGYTVDDITILVASSGQMFYMRNYELGRYKRLRDVKITVINNYQGEESKIILLSLVRNNEENIIGCLGTDNRVCVALSRAKDGLYIFGNINMMKTAKSGFWTKIATTLENNGSLGTTLNLKCPAHPDEITTISTIDRFSSIPRSRCYQMCNYQYQCGHQCRLYCHGYDPEHINNKCYMKCERVLCELGHVCPLDCYEDCKPCKVLIRKTLPCGHEMNKLCHLYLEDPQNKCLTTVNVTLPDCEHQAQKLCYQDINEVVCTTPCEYRFKCGHVCGRNCHVTDDEDVADDDDDYEDVADDDADNDDADDDPNHEKHECREPCEYRLECGHVCQRYCHVTDDPNHEEYICRKPCARAKAGCVADLLGDRGDHQCRKLCFEECDDCNAQVEKVIPECHHTIKLQCKQSPSHDLCKEKCKRLLSCGHPCLDRCGAACDPTKCTEPSFTSIRSPCGHRVRLPCNVSRLFAEGEVRWEQLPQYCSTPCGATLACKHLCAGSCAACSQGRLHQPCTQQCNQDNICGHRCQEPCNQICPPCKMPCEVKCVHSRCKKLCCEPCTPCQEPCSQACVHGACSRRCGEPCDRAPCSEQCARLRPCGHRCRGLCGEPCPDICQLCRPDKFPTDFLGDQYEDTAKFIVLQDCGHVLEVDSMDCLMTGDQENIQIRKCPFCRKMIINTNRYKDTVNKMFKDDINPIKLRVYGTQKEIQIKLTELQRKMDRFTEEYGIYLEDYLEHMFIIFISLLEVQKNVSLLEVEMECMYLNMFEMIVECWKTYETQTPKVRLLKDELMEHIKILLEVLKINPQSRIPIKISEQQQNDVGNEIKRLNVIVQLSKLLHLAKSSNDKFVTYQVETTKAVVFSLSVFNEDLALESLKQLQKVIKISAPVTKYERELIVKAIGLKAGHWYKCPNGHYYCIGECGGAMALGRCPEAGCGAAIGGAQHTLTAGNSHAPEMDGSRFAAWSEQANNMANFDPNNIA